MWIQEAVQEDEQKVDELIKNAKKYLAALTLWKKSCLTGHVINRQKAARAAEELSHHLVEPTAEASTAWTFDVKVYLENGEWRKELQATCREKYDLRVSEDEEGQIVSPPILVRSQPAKSGLQLGKVSWPTLHPEITAKELKRQHDKSVSDAECKLFLNSLYQGCKRISGDKSGLSTKFRELYDLFAMAPGWKKDNSEASFGQQIHALNASNIRVTDGKTFDLEGPSGKHLEKEVFLVVSKSGSPIQYYMIWFR